jgi:DNA-binding transcriptional LysR family regulator
MPISTDLVKAFVTLCQVKSYSETAKMLRRSQPTISNRIRLLEDQVGFALFKDKTPHSGLTAQAELLYQRCLAIQNELDQISVLTQTQVGKVIRIGVSASLENLCSGSAIASLGLGRADTTLSMSTDETENLLASVEKGNLDACYICNREVPSPLTQKSWPFDVRWVAAKSVDVDDLLARPIVPIVGWHEQWQPAQIFSAYFEKSSYRFRPIYQTQNLSNYLNAVQAGVGLGYIGDIFLHNLPVARDLHYIDDKLKPFGQFYIHRLNQAEPAANLRRVLSIIDSHLDRLATTTQ